MQYVAIKEEKKNGKKVFVINAIALKNTNKTIVQKIPHPLGSDTLYYESIDEAKEAISRAGFAYVLPNGQKGIKEKKVPLIQNKVDYSQIVLSTIKSKINSTNSNVVAAAITAISEFPTDEIFDILFEKIGEENDLVRKNAIAGICRYGNLLQDRIIESLKSPNWVVRNSCLTCIQNLTEFGEIELEKFLLPLTSICEDSNSIVQANALITLARIYQEYQKNIQK